VPSNDQATDIFTKALSRPLFENYRRKLGMMSTRDLRLKEDVENGHLQARDLEIINKICKISTKSRKRAEREKGKCNIICLKW
jgi:hypothetical protein